MLTHVKRKPCLANNNNRQFQTSKGILVRVRRSVSGWKIFDTMIMVVATADQKSNRCKDQWIRALSNCRVQGMNSQYLLSSQLLHQTLQTEGLKNRASNKFNLSACNSRSAYMTISSITKAKKRKKEKPPKGQHHDYLIQASVRKFRQERSRNSCWRRQGWGYGEGWVLEHPLLGISASKGQTEEGLAWPEPLPCVFVW